MKAVEFTQKIIENSFFTESQLAKILGVDQTTISHWKNGTRTITSDKFFELLDVLGYSKFDFLKGDYDSKVKLGFKAKSIDNNEDLLLISKINKLAANSSFMDSLEGDDDNE